MEAAPEFFESGYYDPVFSPEKRLSVDAKNADHFAVDDLLDLPNDDDTFVAPVAPLTENSADSSPLAAPHHSSSFSADPHFSPAAHFSSGELCVPYEESAELEWLSKFVEDSFSSEDLQKLHLIQGPIANPPNDAVSSTNHYHPQTQSTATATLRPQLSVPAKARSKRSRAAPGNWTSRLLAVSSPASPAMSSSSDSEKKPGKPAALRKREGGHDGGGEGRKCLHCATDKTPQWRTGPMGPKTLCNACGVRYKSGRLVPEYRPAASPTFTLTKHSNSHRKVLELRRQKEMQKAQPQPTAPQPYLHHHHHLHQNVVFDVPNGEDYLIHQHIGPDYRQLI